MAVVIIQEPPIPITAEMYDKVNARARVEDDPPNGLIFHSAGADDSGKWRIIDVWESRDDYDRFRSERLGPAIQETAQEFGVDPGEGPRVTAYEAHHVVAPAPVHTHA